MKRFAGRLCLLLPILGMVVLVNYKGDPAHLYQHFDYEKGVATILLVGKNVINYSFYCDERMLQKFYADGVTISPEVLVIGSSRAMEIRSNLFVGKRFYNASVSNATLEDLYAVYGLFRGKATRPKQVILGLDSLLLDISNENELWRTLTEEYALTSNAAGLAEGNSILLDLLWSNFTKTGELFSPAYFQSSFKAIVEQLKSAPEAVPYYASEERVSDLTLKLADGSLIYDKDKRSAPASNTQATAVTYAHIIQPVQIVPARAVKLKALLRLLQMDGVQVTLYFYPYPPGFYDRIVTGRNCSVTTNPTWNGERVSSKTSHA